MEFIIGFLIGGAIYWLGYFVGRRRTIRECETWLKEYEDRYVRGEISRPDWLPNNQETFREFNSRYDLPE